MNRPVLLYFVMFMIFLGVLSIDRKVDSLQRDVKELSRKTSV